MSFWALFFSFTLCISLVLGQNETGCICFEELPDAREFINPLIILSAEDGTDRLFIGEQIGVLWIFERNTTVPGGWWKHPEPFMNISVHYESLLYDEQGFLALRFHPQYSANGLLYVWYSVFKEDTGRNSRLAEFRVDPNNPNQIDLEYERIILDLPQIATNHNGGEILFMDDGTMLVTTGDGGVAGDPTDAALDKSSLLGKTIRIDVDGRDEGLEYAIPPDNPFIDDPEARPEVYAYGLRNPWRAFMDKGDQSGNGRGRVFMGDVGQNAWEEIDILYAGDSYGWSAYEARTCYKPQICAEHENHTYPIVWYSHTEGIGQCIIQGPMYRGCENPALYGWLIYGDYMTGLMEMVPDQGNAEEWVGQSRINTCSNCEELGYVPDAEYAPWILTYGQDERAEVYVGSAEIEGLRRPNGRVYKMIDPNNRGDACDLKSTRNVVSEM